MPPNPLPPALIEDLHSLIRMDTQNPPGNEAVAARFVAERLRALGAEVRLVSESAERESVVGEFRFGPGPRFLFNSHLDVVPVQSPAMLEPRTEHGYLYARGACDAKGAVIAMLGACERLVRAPVGLSGTLVFTAVADEEVAGAGARRLVAEGLRADAAMIGEPTDNTVHLGARGVFQARVRLFGKAAHSSDPSQGNNAIYGAARFVLAVEQWNHELASRPMNPVVSANVISGGAKINIIADHCEIQVDRRLTPVEVVSDGERELLGRLNEVLTEEQKLRWLVEPSESSRPGFQLDPQHPVARIALEVADQVEPGFFRAGTDASFLHQVGVPCFILGPGSLDVAHTADESVGLADLAVAADLYERLSRRFLTPWR